MKFIGAIVLAVVALASGVNAGWGGFAGYEKNNL